MKYTKFYNKGVREEDLKVYEEVKKIGQRKAMIDFVKSLPQTEKVKVYFQGFEKLFTKKDIWPFENDFIDDDNNYRRKTKGVIIRFGTLGVYSTQIHIFVVEGYTPVSSNKKEYERDYYCINIFAEDKDYGYLIPMSRDGNAKPGLAEVGDKQIASLIRTLVEEEINKSKGKVEELKAEREESKEETEEEGEE